MLETKKGPRRPDGVGEPFRVTFSGGHAKDKAKRFALQPLQVRIAHHLSSAAAWERLSASALTTHEAGLFARVAAKHLAAAYMLGGVR